MFDIGFPELVVLAVVAMVVIGPERLPGVARTVGRALGQAKRTMRKFQQQLEKEVQLDVNDRPVRGKAGPGTAPSDEVEPAYEPPAESQDKADSNGASR